MYNPFSWFYKSILLYVTCIGIIISMITSNTLLNKYILPYLIFVNIAILIYITLNSSYTLINLLSLIGIVYLLYTFNYKDFEFKNGLLVQPNVQYIMIHIGILSLYYLLSNNSTIPLQKRFLLVGAILYPLLFPIQEYFIHRLFTLTIIGIVGLYYKSLVY